VNRNFSSERGSVATEISQGLVYVAVLAIVGLWVIAHLEGVSFQVLLDQLRHGTQSH
jgi:TRAP-type C4-dicarboxylate transport system permease small subunit